MSYLLAVDPGSATPGSACALFREDSLWSAWFSQKHTEHVCVTDTPEQFLSAIPYEVREVVVERPEYHGARSEQARIKDHQDLAWSGAAVAYYYAGAASAPVFELTPTEWKGREPKPQQHARMWDEVLTTAEQSLLTRLNSSWAQPKLKGTHIRDVIEQALEKGARTRWSLSGAQCYPRGFKLHNVLDAVALGCVYCGRMKGHGTYYGK